MMASPSKRPASARAVARLLLALCAHRGASFQPRPPRAPPPRAALRTRPPSRPPSRSRVPAQPAAGDGDGAGDGPVPPQPFLPAMAPDYAARGPVGRGDFVVSRGGPPVAAELADAQMLQIVRLECTDLEVNTLVWKCLGYRCDEGAGAWTPDAVFPKWKERFPAPPDFIGMTRVYSQEVDKPCLRANQALVRSIPAEHKQSLKKYMKPLGWKGYQYKGLTPNMTRRAQCANWLLYYREELFGYTVEELRERRRATREAEERAAAAAAEEGRPEEWKLPVKEVY